MIKWTPRSLDDLEIILDHISKNFNVDLAIMSVTNILDYVEKLLNENPLAGKIVESNPLFSKIVFEGNSIFYCENPKDKSIYIVYVQPRNTKLKKSRLNKNEVA